MMLTECSFKCSKQICYRLLQIPVAQGQTLSTLPGTQTSLWMVIICEGTTTSWITTNCLQWTKMGSSDWKQVEVIQWWDLLNAVITLLTTEAQMCSVGASSLCCHLLLFVVSVFCVCYVLSLSIVLSGFIYRTQIMSLYDPLKIL